MMGTSGFQILLLLGFTRGTAYNRPFCSVELASAFGTAKKLPGLVLDLSCEIDGSEALDRDHHLVVYHVFWATTTTTSPETFAGHAEQVSVRMNYVQDFSTASIISELR